MRHLTTHWPLGLAALILASLLPQPIDASLIDYLSLDHAGGRWHDGGFRIDWTISHNDDDSWHYSYTLSDWWGDYLLPDASHLILELTKDFTVKDIYNIKGDVDHIEIGDFGRSPSNPGFPEGEWIHGIKFDLTGNARHIEFDSDCQPMWGDFYAKGGNKSYAFTDDLGWPVANPFDYNGRPVDAYGIEMQKVLVPGPASIPEPATLTLLLLSGYGLRRRHRPTP